MEKPTRTDDMSEIDWVKVQLDYKYWKMEFMSGRRAYLRRQMAEFHNDESKTALSIDRLERELGILEVAKLEASCISRIGNGRTIVILEGLSAD